MVDVPVGSRGAPLQVSRACHEGVGPPAVAPTPRLATTRDGVIPASLDTGPVDPDAEAVRGKLGWSGAILVAVACGEPESLPPAPVQTSAAEPDTNTDTDSAVPDPGDGSGGTTGLGADGESGDVVPGCDKVDLLFVIDNSGSMADEQTNLVQSFPGFIDSITSQLAGADSYHVGVVTTDVYTYDLTCLPQASGNLVQRTGGPNSSSGQCGPYEAGGAYMTELDDLPTAFSCAAAVGVGGDGNERPMDAMLTALSDQQRQPGACNEGFLRDDALLVVVVITDEEDDDETAERACAQLPQSGSQGGPTTWFSDLVAVKDREESIVVLSLVGPDAEFGELCAPLDKCNGGIAGAEQADRILAFTRMFTFGFIGRVCDDYGPAFDESIAVIKDACDTFIPVG